MAEGKRYYWLKLKEDFFKSKRIKKLRNMAGGDTYTIIYLKMQLLSLRTEGVLQWTGLEDNFADELALDLDEKSEDVEVTLMYLLKTGLAETIDNVSFVLPWVLESTGSENASAQRVREFRERQKLLQCNTNVTEEKRECNVEIELDIENRDREKKRRFTPPSVEEVKAYCDERKNNVDPQSFVDFYSSKGWKVGSSPMKDWQAAVRTWEKRDNEKPKYTKKYTTAAEYIPPKPESTAAIWDVVEKI